MRLRTLLEIGTGKKTVVRAMAEEVLHKVAGRLKSCMDFRGEGLLILDAGGGSHAKGSAGSFIAQLNHSCQLVVSVNIDRSAHPRVLADLSCHAGWPFRSQVFDLLVSTWVLEHLVNPKLFCEEAGRVLKPGGWLVIGVPFLYHKHGSPQDYYRFTDDALKHLLASSGFAQVEIHPVGSGPFVACISLAWPVLGLLTMFPVVVAVVMDWLLRRISAFLKRGSWMATAYPLAYIACGRTATSGRYALSRDMLRNGQG